MELAYHPSRTYILKLPLGFWKYVHPQSKTQFEFQQISWKWSCIKTMYMVGARWLQDDILFLPGTSTARCRQSKVCWVLQQCRTGSCLTFRLIHWVLTSNFLINFTVSEKCGHEWCGSQLHEVRLSLELFNVFKMVGVCSWWNGKNVQGSGHSWFHGTGNQLALHSGCCFSDDSGPSAV
jgi:hypothetical protein